MWEFRTTKCFISYIGHLYINLFLTLCFSVHIDPEKRNESLNVQNYVGVIALYFEEKFKILKLKECIWAITRFKALMNRNFPASLEPETHYLPTFLT